MLQLPDILRKIISDKKAALHRLKLDLDALKRNCESKRKPLNFIAALTSPGLSVIAEIKKASPSVGLISRDFQPAKIAEQYTCGGADAVSVLTEEDNFKGSPAYLIEVKKRLSGIPILRKDFIFSEVQVYETRAMGADTFLLIAAVCGKNDLMKLLETGRSLGMEALVEVHTEEELDDALGVGARIVGVNNRDLKTFNVDIATSAKLSGRIPTEVIKVSESGIKNADDARYLYDRGFSAILVGETLMKAGLEGAASLIEEFKKIK